MSRRHEDASFNMLRRLSEECEGLGRHHGGGGLLREPRVEGHEPRIIPCAEIAAADGAQHHHVEHQRLGVSEGAVLDLRAAERVDGNEGDPGEW